MELTVEFSQSLLDEFWFFLLYRIAFCKLSLSSLLLSCTSSGFWVPKFGDNFDSEFSIISLWAVSFALEEIESWILIVLILEFLLLSAFSIYWSMGKLYAIVLISDVSFESSVIFVRLAIALSIINLN